MTYQTFSISKSREGFKLHLYKASRFRETVASVLDTLFNKPFGHRFGWQFKFCQVLYGWAWKAEEEIGVINIEREQAVAWSSPGVWDWSTDEQ